MKSFVQILFWILFHSNYIHVLAQNNLRDPATRIIKDQIETKNNRPIIYTFYKRKTSTSKSKLDVNDIKDEQLQVWVDLWKEAGWEPRILTLDDAERHPDFEKYNHKIRLNAFNGYYDYLCFMRWLAMDAQGHGGWMCDFDVIPMGITTDEGRSVHNNGRFTVYERFVPSMASGSAAEWNRMTRLMMDLASENSEHLPRVTDMEILRYIYKRNPDIYIQQGKVMNGFPYKEKNVINCNSIKWANVAHLSHVYTNKAIASDLVTYTGTKNYNVEELRPGLAREMFQNWKKQCLGIV